MSEDEGLVVVADVDPDLWFEVSVEASLAGLETTWTQGPHFVDAAGQVRVALAPPAEAFLHEAALDYLTVLRVRLLGIDRAGNTVLELRAPPAYLAWPEGLAKGAVVWDRPTAESLAPHGIVNASLRATYAGLSEKTWVQPSIHHAVRKSDPLPKGE